MLNKRREVFMGGPAPGFEDDKKEEVKVNVEVVVEKPEEKEAEEK